MTSVEPITNPPKPIVKIGIIGTALRVQEEFRLVLGFGASVIWQQMLQSVENQLRQWNLQPDQVHLISGGAAWSDHVAVRLFIRYHEQGRPFHGLTLYLPANWTGQGYDPNQRTAFTSNFYHQQMSEALFINSLQEIETARKYGATLISGSDFGVRNRKIAANSEFLIAFTWDVKQGRPGSNGTLQTWSMCRHISEARKRLIPLAAFMSARPKTLSFVS